MKKNMLKTIISATFIIYGFSAFSQGFEFSYTFEGKTQTINLSSNSYEQAYSEFADLCFKKLTAGKKVSENRGLDIIDACANPKTKKM